MNYYSVFYWLAVANGVKKFFDTASDIFTTFAVISFIGFLIASAIYLGTISDKRIESEEEEKQMQM